MKRILAALCALTMLFTFAACGDDPVEQSADNNGAAVGDSNDNNGGTPSDDGFAKVESVYDEALTGYFDLRILGLGERMVDIVPSCVWTAIERTPEEAARGAGTFITINWYNEVGTGDMSYVFTVDKVEEDAYRDSVKDALALRGGFAYPFCNAIL